MTAHSFRTGDNNVNWIWSASPIISRGRRIIAIKVGFNIPDKPPLIIVHGGISLNKWNNT